MGRREGDDLAAKPGRGAKKLIRAAALAAKDKGDLPPELVMRQRCRAWGLPPRPGGMDDQDYQAIRRMEVLESAYLAVKAWRKGKMTPDEQKTFNWLIEQDLTK